MNKMIEVVLLGRVSVLKDGWRAVKMKRWISTGIINGSVIVKGLGSIISRISQGKEKGAGTLATKPSVLPSVCSRVVVV